jgi:plastocyanin
LEIADRSAGKTSMCGNTRLAPVCGTSKALYVQFMTRIAAALLLLASLVGPIRTKAEEQGVEISIDNFTFAPAAITIPAGTVVTWVNRDDIPHTVVEKSLRFRSRALDTDDTFTHQFNDIGEIDYFCSLHPHMTGRIIVKAKGS